MDKIIITNKVLDLNDASNFVKCSSAGAVTIFQGTTKDVFEGKIVKKLSYEAYDGMAEKELKKICEQMRQRWNILRIYVEHRLGEVPVGEVSVIIAVSAVHRADSIQAVEYCINNLKSTVPIWKKEIYSDDTGLWKENRESCQTVQQHTN